LSPGVAAGAGPAHYSQLRALPPAASRHTGSGVNSSHGGLGSSHKAFISSPKSVQLVPRRVPLEPHGGSAGQDQALQWLSLAGQCSCGKWIIRRGSFVWQCGRGAQRPVLISRPELLPGPGSWARRPSGQVDRSTIVSRQPSIPPLLSVVLAGGSSRPAGPRALRH
jgi:hypothetical protein